MNELHAPRHSPSVRQKTMMVPARGESLPVTSAAPSIIQQEATYPLDRANRIINKIEHASLLKTTGSCDDPTLQSRNSGMNTTRATDGTQEVAAVKGHGR